MPTRCCSACRIRTDSSELIRLHCNAEHHLFPINQKPLKGRSAWVCPKKQCIQKLIKHPKALQSSLRICPKTDQFLLILHHYLWNESAVIFQRMQRAGLVYVFDPNSKKQRKKVEYWILLQDGLAKIEKKEYFRGEDISYVQVKMDEIPPSHPYCIVGIQSGKLSQLLRRHLQLLETLLEAS